MARLGALAVLDLEQLDDAYQDQVAGVREFMASVPPKQGLQSGFMTVLMEPVDYLMSAAASTISGLSSSLNFIRTFIDKFRNNLTSSIQNIFGVFLNMLTQIQVMVIKIKDMMAKNIGIMTTLMYTMDTSMQTMQNTWAGPIGKTVRAL